MQKSFLRPSRMLQVGGGSLALMAFLLAGQGNIAQAASHKHFHNEHARHHVSAVHHVDRNQHAFQHDKKQYDAFKKVETTYRYHKNFHAYVVTVTDNYYRNDKDVVTVTDNYRNDENNVAVTDCDEDELATKQFEQYCAQEADEKYEHHNNVVAYKHDDHEKYEHYNNVVAYKHDEHEKCEHHNNVVAYKHNVDEKYKRHNNVVTYKHDEKYSSKAVNTTYGYHQKGYTNVIANNHSQKHSTRVVGATRRPHKHM